jgi:transposase
MIISARQVEVYAYGEPCDMRKSFNTLSALVKQQMGRDVWSGALFLFLSKDRKRAKVLYFDGTGLCLFAKRLEKGRFAPLFDRVRSRTIRMTLSELTQFIEGSDAIGKSPDLLTWADLTPRWPEEKSKNKSLDETS